MQGIFFGGTSEAVTGKSVDMSALVLRSTGTAPPYGSNRRSLNPSGSDEGESSSAVLCGDSSERLESRSGAETVFLRSVVAELGDMSAGVVEEPS